VRFSPTEFSGEVRRGLSLQTAGTLLSLKGIRRPSGSGLARNVRSTRYPIKLLEQLRPIPVSGEADLSFDYTASDWEKGPGLRRRTKCSGLDIRRRSLR